MVITLKPRKKKTTSNQKTQKVTKKVAEALVKAQESRKEAERERKVQRGKERGRIGIQVKGREFVPSPREQVQIVTPEGRIERTADIQAVATTVEGKTLLQKTAVAPKKETVQEPVATSVTGGEISASEALAMSAVTPVSRVRTPASFERPEVLAASATPPKPPLGQRIRSGIEDIALGLPTSPLADKPGVVKVRRRIEDVFGTTEAGRKRERERAEQRFFEAVRGPRTLGEFATQPLLLPVVTVQTAAKGLETVGDFIQSDPDILPRRQDTTKTVLAPEVGGFVREKVGGFLSGVGAVVQEAPGKAGAELAIFRGAGKLTSKLLRLGAGSTAALAVAGRTARAGRITDAATRRIRQLEILEQRERLFRGALKGQERGLAVAGLGIAAVTPGEVLGEEAFAAGGFISGFRPRPGVPPRGVVRARERIDVEALRSFETGRPPSAPFQAKDVNRLPPVEPEGAPVLETPTPGRVVKGFDDPLLGRTTRFQVEELPIEKVGPTGISERFIVTKEKVVQQQTLLAQPREFQPRPLPKDVSVSSDVKLELARQKVREGLQDTVFASDRPAVSFKKSFFPEERPTGLTEKSFFQERLKSQAVLERVDIDIPGQPKRSLFVDVGRRGQARIDVFPGQTIIGEGLGRIRLARPRVRRITRRPRQRLELELEQDIRTVARPKVIVAARPALSRKQLLEPKLELEEEETLISRPRIDTVPRIGQPIKPVQTTTPGLDTQLISGLGLTGLGFTIGRPKRPRRPDDGIPKTPDVPALPSIPLQVGGDPLRSKQRFVGGRARAEFTPSFAAFELDIRGEKPRKKRRRLGFTGLELRPL